MHEMKQVADGGAAVAGSGAHMPTSQSTHPDNNNTTLAGIDIRRETIIRLADVRNYLPLNAKGRKMDKSVAFRWASCGLRGHRLEFLQQGGVRVTSLEAIQRFFDRLTVSATAEPSAEKAHRQQEIESAAARMKAMLKRGK